MGNVKGYWKDDPKYKRVIEILEEYWRDQPHESRVKIFMEFKRGEFDYQTKAIVWENPNIRHVKNIDTSSMSEAIDEALKNIGAVEHESN